MASRANLEDMENRTFMAIPGLILQPLGHPAYSQSAAEINNFNLYFTIYEIQQFSETIMSVKFL
jgi:hypothetical protein